MKPCPFCNCKRTPIIQTEDDMFVVMCWDCECRGPVAGTEEIARKMWDERNKERPKRNGNIMLRGR